MLSALMTDRALTATELADIAGVTKQTVSSHLAKLLDAGLVKVDQQGRHRFFRLAGRDIARLLESLMGIAFRTGPVRPRTGPREPALRKARFCYDHLAGELAVQAYDGLLECDVLREESGGLRLTEYGREWFRHIEIDTCAVAAQRRSFCRGCLDWSERRYHLAGALGAALLERIQKLGWARCADDSRAVVFTSDGEKSFRALFEAPGAHPQLPNKAHTG